jgi:hypothetical protein
MILEGEQLVIEATTNKDLLGKKQMLTEDSIATRALHKQDQFKDDDLKIDPALRKLMRRKDEDDDGMFISAPIMTQSGVVGIFNISEKVSSQPYTDAESKTLNEWVARISPVVENAKLNMTSRWNNKGLKGPIVSLRSLRSLKRICST